MERTNECLCKLPAINARMLVIVIHCVSLTRSCNYAHASLATPTWQIRRAAESAKTAVSGHHGPYYSRTAGISAAKARS